MAMYAHAVIELEDRTIERGSEVSRKDFSDESWEALVEAGTISEDEYDASADEVPMPDVVEIDGVKYIKEPADA